MSNATAVLERHWTRLTPETVTRYRTTARTTPLVVGVGTCLECGHAAGCDCECCPYQLPAVVGAVIGTGVGA